MASGKPDWNRIVTIQGKHDDDWLPIGVDTNGNILARLKGLFGADTLKDVLVDTNGNLIAIIKGEDTGTLRTIFVDDSGKMVTRVQSATGGNLVVFVLDDCGDTDKVSNWSQAEDALEPVVSTTFVREGTVSMKLGIDASIFGTDVATWMNSVTIGDLTGLNNDKVKIWVYINTIDYLLAAGTCFHFRIGSGGADYIGFNFTKASLTVGWNEISCDLSSPDMTFGTIDWSAINTQLFEITAVAGNTDDFYVIVDSIVVVRDNPDPGTMKDLNVDANGFLLSRMVGSFGDYLKPLACDRYGNLRINPTQADKKPIISAGYQQNIHREDMGRSNVGTGTFTLATLTGPGVILWGYLYHYAASSHKNCHHSLVVDGVTFTSQSFNYQNGKSLNVPGIDILYLSHYDDTAKQYINGFSEGIVFQESLVVQIVETVGNSTNYGYLGWANF